MFRVLIADDNYEDRELLKLEIERSLAGDGADIRFHEASSIAQAFSLLKEHPFDLLTLDIQFDRLSEGIEALPEIFEAYPTLSVIVISGKLDKNEVTEQLFRFTKDNVLKGKRWIRHFDVLDKKDDKGEALRRAYAFVFKQKESLEKVRDLFLLAETFLEKEDHEKCTDIYQKIQTIAPGEPESGENIDIIQGRISPEQIVSRMRKGDRIVAALLLGYYLETRLKIFTRRLLGRSPHALSDALKELERSSRFGAFRKDLFRKLLSVRNKAIHHPSHLDDHEVDEALRNLKHLETKF